MRNHQFSKKDGSDRCIWINLCIFWHNREVMPSCERLTMQWSLHDEEDSCHSFKSIVKFGRMWDARRNCYWMRAKACLWTQHTAPVGWLGLFKQHPRDPSNPTHPTNSTTVLHLPGYFLSYSLKSYLIFVTGTTGAARVKVSAWCKFFQIERKKTTYLTLLGVNFSCF